VSRKARSGGRTLRWLLERYLEEKLLAPATQQMYEAAVQRWIAETGITALRGVTRQRVLAWRREILATRSPETRNKRRRHLRALFAFAIERGWVRRKNPFAEVGPAPNPPAWWRWPTSPRSSSTSRAAGPGSGPPGSGPWPSARSTTPACGAAGW